jgi:hypothetical protein
MSAIKQTSATKWLVKRVYNIFSVLLLKLKKKSKHNARKIIFGQIHIRVGNAGK